MTTAQQNGRGIHAKYNQEHSGCKGQAGEGLKKKENKSVLMAFPGRGSGWERTHKLKRDRDLGIEAGQRHHYEGFENRTLHLPGSCMVF